MNIAIAGEGALSLRLAEALMGSHDVVCISSEAADRPQLERLDIEVVPGQVTSADTLRQARAQTAELFIACTQSDEQNIVSCLLAQGMGAGRSVCVLTGGGFSRLGEQDETLADTLGIDTVIRPDQQLADEVVRIVTVPGALDVEVFAGGRVGLMRYAVSDGAPMTRAPLRDLRLPNHVVLVTVRRDDELHLPTGDTRLKPGDKIIAMGRGHALRRLLPLMSESSVGRQKRRATIVGAGSVGYSIARQLEQAHWQVKLIESDPHRCEQVAANLESLVLHGDGADLAVLQQEHVDEVPVLIAVTNSDERNLLISLLAKHLGVERIITRADRYGDEIIFEKAGVDVVRSKYGAAVRSVLAEIGGPDQDQLRAELEHGDARVIELTLPQTFRTTSLIEMKPPTLAVVGSILRGRRVIVPSGRDELRADDHILVFCTREDEAATRDFFLRSRNAVRG